MPKNKKNDKRQISFVLPVYNEKEAIGEVLKALLNDARLKEIDYEIIVVDDCSEDQGCEMLGDFDVRVIRHEENKGYGAALKTGIQHAKHDIIAICDADGSYPIERVFDLVGLINDYDMVVGARVNNYARLHLIRYPVKWILNKYANYLVKTKIPDLNSGLRVFRKEVYGEFRHFLPSGFSFTSTITLALLSNNYRVKYVPIDYLKRSGKSKFRPISDTINFLSLIIRTSLYFNPFRIYMPIALLLLVMGIFLFIYNAFALQNITDLTLLFFLFGMQFLILALLADTFSRHRRK
jgi:glycosyltransferase involved in cell wall biosynthesis